MKSPNAASLLVLLASGALLLAASPRLHSDAITVNRDFLAPLATAVDERDADGGDVKASDLLWPNFDELVFLTRKGDLKAIQIVQQLLTREAPPGACGCFADVIPNAVFADYDIPKGFLEQLPRLEPKDQATILTRMDWALQHSPAGGYEDWMTTRAAFLTAHPVVAAVYHLPEFEPQASEPGTPVADSDNQTTAE